LTPTPDCQLPVRCSAGKFPSACPMDSKRWACPKLYWGMAFSQRVTKALSLAGAEPKEHKARLALEAAAKALPQARAEPGLEEDEA
jgi:hypothetical protein